MLASGQPVPERGRFVVLSRTITTALDRNRPISIPTGNAAMLVTSPRNGREYLVEHHQPAEMIDVTPPRQRVDPERVIQAWIAERVQEKKNKPKPRAIANKRSKLARLFAFLAGVNKPGRMTKAEVDSWMQRGDIGAIASADLRRYRGHLMPLGIAWDHFTDILPLFKIAFNNDLIATNPANGFQPPAKPQHNSRSDFHLAEQRIILIASRSAPPLIRWANWIAAFTGVITEEIVQATTADVYEKEGVWVLNIRPPEGENLKTFWRPRELPLHPSIIREGFLDYWRSLPPGPLFPGLPGGDRVCTVASKTINDFNRAQGVGWKIDQNGKRVKDPLKVFYSWRHTVGTRLETVVMDLPEGRVQVEANLANYITGHAPVGARAKHYVHPKLYVLVAAINGLPDPTLSAEVLTATAQ